MDPRFTDYGIDIPSGAKPTADGDVKALCPRCKGTRKPGHRNDRPLSVNLDKGVWHCFNCGWKGALGRPETPVKEYEPPAPVESGALYSKARQWFQDRGISAAILEQMQITATGQRIFFPYFLDGEHINTKKRRYSVTDPTVKGFSQDTGTRHSWYNVDAVREGETVYIVESEKDVLSLLECGFEPVISCPDGAGTLSNEWFDDVDWDSKKRIVLAGDMDEKGQAFCLEVARRVGFEKCWTVQWPDGENDANDTLWHIGPDAVMNAIFDARPFPIEGVIAPHQRPIEDAVLRLYHEGMKRGAEVDWPKFNELLTWAPGHLTVVGGYPGSGKGEWLDDLFVRLARQHDWKFVVYSPENYPVELHLAKLLMKVRGKPFGIGPNERMSEEEVLQGMTFLDEHFRFINPETPTLDNLLELARIEKRRFGANAVLIDPMNEVITNPKGGETLAEYISTMLSELKRFLRANMMHGFLVSHPRKPIPTNKALVPGPFEAANSATFFTKADNFLAVGRNKADPSQPVEVHVQKVRFRNLGKEGVCYFSWRPITGQYVDLSVSVGGLEI